MNFKKLTLSLLALSTLAVLTDANAASQTIVKGDKSLTGTINLKLEVAEFCEIDGVDLFDGQDKTLTRTASSMNYSLSLGNLSASCNGKSFPTLQLTSQHGGPGSFKLEMPAAGAAAATTLAYTVALGSKPVQAGSAVILSSTAAGLVFSATATTTSAPGDYSDTVTATFTLS